MSPLTLDEGTLGLLEQVSTASVAMLLQRRRCDSFMRGLRPLHPASHMVGIARTLRYLPFRSDLADEYLPDNAQRRAVESIEPGEVLVIDAREVTDAGTIGDIYALRAFERGAAGIVTDGCLRDTGAVAALQRPVFNLASHGATFSRRHLPYSVNDSIACGGVLVQPGDVVMGDSDGVVVIPRAMADEIAIAAREVEISDEWSLEQVRDGASTFDVFPISAARKSEFDEWRSRRSSREPERQQ
jgi:5-oxopent-3-ene-1,2,5-tricarboxylate decarboxylase / 2-hydroxyhepta-2,4-diene-1,7-dioate isomerase